MKKRFVSFLLGFLVVTVMAQNTSVQPIWNSDWVATDALGRSTPTHAITGPSKQRWVGVFYWLWHGSVRTNPIRDISKEMTLHPSAPQWVWADWWWGEPENGYYHSGDPWVARKNMTMLAHAGVDFVYFDYTNGPIGHAYLNEFLDVALDLQQQGVPVPRIVFFLNADAQPTLDKIYNDLYKPGKYSSLWFYWDGKPLLMESSQYASSQEIRDFFTFRDAWAFQASQDDQWRFIDDYPQRASYHNGVVEQMVVNKGMGAPLVWKGQANNKGSSYTWHNAQKGILPVYDQYWVSDSTPYGLYFAEQFNRADSIDAPLLLITGWNEWTAGAWNMDAGQSNSYTFLGKNLDEDPGHWHFVDQFNKEFNRDLEPMKGGYGDSYYWQLVQRVRHYKGLPPPTVASGPTSMNIEGDFAAWSRVQPVYKDPIGDTEHRNYRNCDNSAMLVNTTGRNDIVEARTAHDAQQVYFYVKAAANLTPSSDPQWMELWIDSDQNSTTGWQGFEFQIEGLINGGKRILKKWNGAGWTVLADQVFAKAQGSEMEMSIAKSVLGLGAQPAYDFKWSDNIGNEGTAMAFVDHGDAAPDRRFKYRYQASAPAIEVQAPYPGPAAHSVPGVIEVENFDKGGEGVSYHDTDPANNGGQYRNTGVDIQAIPGGGYSVGWVSTGEWLEYSIQVSDNFSAQLFLRAASALGRDTVRFFLNGAPVGDPLAFAQTGGLHSYDSVATTFAMPAGSHVLRLHLLHSAGGFNMDHVRIIIQDTPVLLAPVVPDKSKTTAKFFDLIGRWKNNPSPSPGRLP